MFAQYPKEHILEKKQIPIHVSDLPKKPTIGDKIKPLGSQRVKPENVEPRVTWLGHLVMPFRMGKCQSQHVLLHLKK